MRFLWFLLLGIVAVAVVVVGSLLISAGMVTPRSVRDTYAATQANVEILDVSVAGVDIDGDTTENDISITKSDDQTIGDEVPADDRVHVFIPTSRDISVSVTNNQVPADIEIAVSAMFTGTEIPPQCEIQLDPPNGSKVIIGNWSVSELSWREPGFAAYENRVFTVPYEIHCTEPVNLADALQIVVNALSYRQGSNDVLPDPDMDNNQDQNKVDVISDDDYDGDTVPTPNDNCPNTANSGQQNAIHPATPQGDHCEDPDSDNFSDYSETFIGTDPDDDCPNYPTHDAWPPDFNDDRFINLTDIIWVLPPYFGSGTGDPDYSQRWDLSPDGVINITDVVNVLPPAFGSTCTP